jgi:tetratricopeptide (TPR) repeat protein
MCRNKSGRLSLALFFLISGCASIPPQIRALPPGGSSIELRDTPFYAQQDYQCGPAALTTVLAASGANVSLEGIVSKVYLPGREGSLQVEMLAATRTSARLPYIIDGRLGAIHDELEAGRAIVVLQNLGVAVYPVWHYAVVVGIDDQNSVVILRSGAERRHETRINTFLRTWRRSNYWGMVVLEPGELPSNVDRSRYLSAVAALEGAGQIEAARLAWSAAIEVWPGDLTAGFGLANVLAAQGDFSAAVSTYSELLAQYPDLVVARNNLALALARLGQFDAAEREIERALADNTDEKLVAELLDTQESIRADRAAK